MNLIKILLIHVHSQSYN